jgi:hypothetical protein
MLKAYTSIIFLFIQLSIFSQNDSINISKSKIKNERLYPVLAFGGSTYISSIVILNSEWYKNYPRSSFHFYNDIHEWCQMDKFGHAFTSYNIGEAGIDLLSWSGVDKKSAIWFGGLAGSLYLLNIEILDGLSKQWGFSITDFAANTVGSSIVIAEGLAWNEQRIRIKWSFHQTKYEQYRPEELGGNLAENMLKDYNGQTYWFSTNIYSFLNKGSGFPKWLNIDIGYGAEGMTGGANNPTIVNGKAIPSFQRYRKYFVSLDLDLTKIKTKSQFLNTVFRSINLIKIPAPTFEFSKNGVQFNPLYF